MGKGFTNKKSRMTTDLNHVCLPAGRDTHGINKTPNLQRDELTDGDFVAS